MNRIFCFFVDNWKFSFLTTLFIFIIGVLSFGILQRESFPPVNFAVVSISTVFPGASPEEVQDKVTQIIEEELRGIAGIKDVRSVSQSDLSDITVRIDIDGIDSEDVVSDIQKAVQRSTAKLPPEVVEAPLVVEVDAKEIPVLELAIVGSNENRKRDILADHLQDEIEDIKGISSVRLSGYLDRELQVLLDHKKLQRLGVGLTEVFSALSQQIKNIPSGYIDDRSEISLVRVFGKKIKRSDLERTIIRTNNAGQTIRIQDVGRVEDAGKKPNLLSRINGEEATILVTTKKADADALKVLGEVQRRIDQFAKDLSSDFKLVVYNDEGARIKNRLNIVSFNAISGMIIVLIVLFIFLPGQAGLMSSLSLPICGVGTIAAMVFFDANFNIITMIALVICLGNLVDNSVVISENYMTLVEKGMSGRDAAIKSANQFWIPFTASTITIISAFLPMLVTKGVLGQFIKWIPVIVTIALSISLIESLTLLPARLQFLKAKKRQATTTHWFQSVEEKFAQLIRWTLDRKYLTVLSLFLLVVSGIFVNSFFNRFELFPADGVEYYVGRYEANPKTSLYKTDDLGAQVSRQVVKVMDPAILQAVVSRSGVSQTDPADPRSKVGSNVGIIMVAIRPEKAPDVKVADTLKILNAIPKPSGLERLVFEPIESGPPIGKPLTLTLRSSNYGQLSDARDAILTELKKIQGLVNLEDDEQMTGTEFLFEPNEEARSYAGLSVESIGLNLRTALEGSTAARLTEFGKEFDLVVRFDEKSRNTIDDLKKMEVLAPSGNIIPLAALGKFQQGSAPKTKKKYEYKNSITITSEVDNINVTSQTANKLAQSIFLKIQDKFPLVSAVYGGEEESTNESLQSLAIALLMALFGIFATLVFTFGSYTQSILVLSTIPLGLVGVFYSFTAIQRPLSFLAFIGVVGLTGVVINSAIILVDYIRELQLDRAGETLKELLIEASKKRLRAVLATGLTTVVGLLPTAFGWGGYDAVLVDITLALSWGMIIGTVLTLVWIPSGFLIFSEFKSWVLRKFGIVSLVK